LVPMGGGGGGGIPPRPPSGGGRGGGGIGGFGRALGGINLPGTGVVREIGNEFAMATKQVLLFGTAYKALAFLTSFPAQVGQAVGALQSFNNTLKAISPTAEEARASNQFILDIVDRYNVPLQSARDGFTKLYASMAPAGFQGDEIRDLFTGVSQAAATFGMSADKVDRVNYAFAQMASKGQVMSEELKGQLGDVLPGAMGIFAEAAGFKGPDAIQKFSKALEDGAYKGEAMRGLLKNVTVVLTKEFGPGAEGAARTFQGVINRMQNSTKLLYEAFEPVAVGFLNSVVVPLTSGIKTVSDGFNAFLKGTSAQTSGGFAIAQELEKLRPTFDGLRQNALQLVQVFGQFAQIGLEAGKVLLQIAGNPIVGFLAKMYAIVVPLNMALGVMRGLWALNALQLVIFNARISAGTTTLTAFRLMMQATGATAAATAATIRAGFASTGVGIVLVGIGLLIERFMSMNQALADTRAKALGAADAIRSMSQAEARQAENQATRDIKILQSLRQKKNEGKSIVAITKEEQAALERAGVKTGKMVVPGQMARRGSLPELLGYGQQAVDVTQIQGALLAREGIAATAKRQIEDLRFQEKQQTTPTAVAPITGTGAEGGAAGVSSKRVPLEQLLDTESQRVLKLNLSKADLRLTQLITEAKLQGNEAEAESLEGLSNSLKLRLQLTAAQNFVTMLLDKEDEIVGKSLTKQQFSNKLQDANVEVQTLSNDLQASYLEMQVKENEASKKAKDALNEKIKQQLSLNRLLEDAAITAGVVSPQQSDIRMQNRGFEDQLLQAQELGATPKQISFLQTLQAATPQVGSLQEALREIEKGFSKLTSMQEMAKTSANAIGDAFGNAFKGIITGSMTAREALAGFFQSIADSFADMVAKMIAEWLKAQLIRGFMNIFGLIGGGLGGGGSVLGGNSSAAFGINSPDMNKYAPLQPMANGGVLSGGFQAFANGGIVTGPTLGLVGEGRYNEAVIPLPDGKSVPVDLGGAMGGQAVNNIVVNVDAKGSKVEGDEQEGKQLGRVIAAAIQQELVKQKRPGGLLA
jgi:tape measure domain-containing protein